MSREAALDLRPAGIGWVVIGRRSPRRACELAPVAGRAGAAYIAFGAASPGPALALDGRRLALAARLGGAPERAKD